MTKGARIDLTGRRWSCLTVLRPARYDAWGPTAWHCRCACGARVVIAHGLLVGRRARSCGCRKRGGPPGRHARRDRAIVAAWKKGKTCAALAQRFGLTAARVQAIIREATAREQAEGECSRKERLESEGKPVGGAVARAKRAIQRLSPEERAQLRQWMDGLTD